jgi:hypothetical protein
MIPDPLNVLSHFHFNVVHELLLTREHSIGEHEVLPNQDTLLIAKVVESITFIVATTPDSNGIVLGLNCIINDVFVDLPGDTRHEHVCWNVVASFEEDVSPVKSEVE